MSKAKLRTKSGCLTCRKRKVKCGEERPLCINCTTANRQCEWPSQDSLVDGRSRRCSTQLQLVSQRRGSCEAVDAQGHDKTLSCHSTTVHTPVWLIPVLAPLRSIPLRSTIHTELDNELLVHYHDSFNVLLLSTAHQGFHEDYRSHALTVGLSCQGVMSSLLAWSASNKFVRSNDKRYRQAALGYYSHAVSAVKEGIAKLESTGGSRLDDSMMIMVEYLYLHSLWGSDTGVDARKHVSGAMNLLSLRYGDTTDMIRPFDRVSVESVLYQAFLLHMRFPFSPNFHVDDEFVHQTEILLDYLGFEDAGAAENSPVLGLPLELYRLILEIITHFSTTTCSEYTLSELRDQIHYWEKCLALVEHPEFNSPLKNNPHVDAIALYILTTSLLLDLMIVHHSNISSPTSMLDSIPQRQNWQVSQVLAMFINPSGYDRWTHCYIALWPVLIVGYALEDEGDISFLKQMLVAMRECMGYGEVQRVHDELDLFWDSKLNQEKRADSVTDYSQVFEWNHEDL